MLAISPLRLLAGSFSSRRLIPIILAAITASGAVAFGRSWSKSLAIPRSSPILINKRVIADPPRVIAGQVETERITIRPTGFEPAEITRPQGRFILAVDNRSGLDVVNLRLSSENGNRRRNVRMSREEPDWNDLVDLPPDHYLLTEADHPDWVCRITITTR